jgi:hypothetical protein
MAFSKFKIEKFSVSAGTLFIIQGALLLLVAPLQIDPHHDGIILGAAIASSTGFLGPNGAFSQYGPLSPLFHGWFLDIFGDSMLNLRYFAALNALLISYLLFSLIRKVADRWVSLAISSTWVFTSAIWATTFPGSLLPWPSLIATGLLLGGMNLMFPLFGIHDLTNTQFIFRLLFSGFLFGLSGFARQQSWIAIFVGAILLVVLYKKFSKELAYFLCGTTVSLSLMFLWLINLGAWSSYINQVFRWPLSAYSTLGMNNNYNRYQFASYIVQTVVFLLLILSIGKLRTLIKSKYAFALTSFTILTVTIFSGFWISKQNNWNATLRVMAGEPQEKIILSFSYFACVSAIVIPLFILVKSKFRIQSSHYQALFLSSLGLVGVIQLYPQPDVLHLWWVSPIFFPSAIIAFQFMSNRWKLLNFDNLMVVVSASSVLGLVLAVSFILRPWVEYQLPVLRGTFAFEEKAKAVNQYSEIQRFIKPGQTSFDCADGVYAVSNGSYLAKDEWFVNWGMLKSENPAVGEVRVICYQNLDYVQSEASRLGMMVKVYVPADYANVSFAVLVSRNPE